MTNKTAEFIPFHALNEFMRPDYRQAVVRAALTALPGLAPNYRAQIERLTKVLVRVPGFRNAAQAPASIRVVPTSNAFEKSPDMTAAILAAWAESQTDLRAKVYDLLRSRGWEVLPVEADRTKLPGFLTSWPAGEDFEKLNRAYAEAHPEPEPNADDVSLMIVWLSGRLPIEVDDAEELEETEGEPADPAPSAEDSNSE